jgi:hypothetical protein
VNALAEGLASKPDAALSEFVCRTETDVMVHSWGLASAAKIFYPDSLESAVVGVVMFGGKGSEGNEVVIENAKGLRVARTTTDEEGEFRFPKLAPGRYRVRVTSGPGEFSKKGVSVTVERGETSQIELRSTSDPDSPAGDGAENPEGASASDTNAPVAIRKRRAWIWRTAVVLVVLIGGGGWVWHSYFRSGKSDAQTTQRISTLTPEKFSSAKPEVQSGSTARAANGGGAGLGAVADEPGTTRSSTAPRETPSIGMPAFSSSPGGGTGSVSKIGTRVELSGVNTPGVNAGRSSSSASVARGAAKQASADHDSPDNLSSLTEARAGTEADSRSENGAAATATTPKTEAEGRSSTGGAPTEKLVGHMPAGMGGSMPGSPAGSETEKKQGMAVDAGLASDDKKTGSSKTAGPPVSDHPKKGNSSGDGAAASSDGGAASGGPGASPISGQGPVVAVTVVEKPSNKSQTPAATTGDAKPANPPEDNSSPPSTPGDLAGGAGKPNSRKDPKAGAKAVVAVSQRGSGNSSGATSSSVPATGVESAGESAKDEKSEPENTANGSSAAASSGAAASVDGAGDKTPDSAPGQEAPKKTGRTARAKGVVQGEPLPAGMQVMGSVKLGVWRLRLGRDAIVPTMPLRDGDKDPAETLRRKMIEDQKLRLPATLKNPKLISGFAFKFAAGAKVRPLRWSSESRLGLTLTVQDNRAELGWALASTPSEVVFTLAYADGTEAARVEFDHDGRATVAVKLDLRAVFLLSTSYAEADLLSSSAASGVAWQVVRGPLASTAWSYDSRWQEGTGCRLEVVLTGVNPAHTRIALVDQASGWQLATELE